MPLGTLWKTTPRPQIKPSNTVLRAYGGQRVTHVGKCQLDCSVNGRNKQCEFYIVNSESPPILGLSMCENLGLITWGVKGAEAAITESINSTYKGVCNGLGCFEEPCHIVVEQDTVPVKEPHRRVPFGLQDRLRLKLDLMEKHKVIKKVNKPTDWVHNLVIVEKEDGSLRLCLDSRELNKAIKRENFQIPIVEDVTCRLSGKKLFTFTMIDLKEVPLASSFVWRECLSHYLQHAVWKIYLQANALWTLLGVRRLTEESVPNIWWHWWCARDCRRHNHCVQQRIRSWSHTHQVVQASPGEEREVQHREIAAQEIEVSYMGNIIGSNGVKPDPSNVEAIVSMREPECKKDIQRLIGMLNYLSQYISDTSTVKAPMRSLLKADVPCVWNTEHEHVFNKVKEIISTTPGLRLFDPNMKVQIQCDASKTGIGACLLQEGQPVVYYSKALTPTQMYWFPIEKECLDVVCAAEKCQH